MLQNWCGCGCAALAELIVGRWEVLKELLVVVPVQIWVDVCVC